jgi:thioredoxin reductase
VADLDERPFPPGDYDVVVVGSGPGGLQTSYCLRRLGVRHAVLSADDGPAGMFQRFPVLGRLISWTQVEAPFERGTREYELYDWNSLLADEPEHRALVAEFMNADLDVPTREDMEQALVAFAARTELAVRYGCRWEATRQEGANLVLVSSDGEYRCRAAVFATGVTEPWKPKIPGIEHVPHYADARPAAHYRGKRVLIIGKGDAGFELAQGLLASARQVTLASPAPARATVLERASGRIGYLQTHGDHGPLVLDASIEWIEHGPDGFEINMKGTTQEGDLELEADEVIAATGFRTPLGDLPELGVATVAHGRIPALTPFWESISVPGVYFAGNATQGGPGLRKHGAFSGSVSVGGHRYNARVLAEHLAESRLGMRRQRRELPRGDLVPYLLSELTRAPELWIQKGYLARALTCASETGIQDEGFLPLEHFVDEAGPNAVAITVEMDACGTTYPAVYVRVNGELNEHVLPPHPTDDFEAEEHQRELAACLQPLL